MEPNWRRSTFSGSHGNDDCVEVARGSAPIVAVRDSKQPGAAISVPVVAWESFLRDLS